MSRVEPRRTLACNGRLSPPLMLAVRRLDAMVDQGQREVYATGANAYDVLVSAEDADGQLADALSRVLEHAERTCLDVGTGTGRIARLVGRKTRTVVGVDRSLHMLQAHRPRSGSRAALRVAANASHLPFDSGVFGVALAGWVFGHATVWEGADWLPVATTYLEELQRVTRPSGFLIVVETLGTCVDDPAPPTEWLGRYYRWLEREQGFSREVVQTSYDGRPVSGPGNGPASGSGRASAAAEPGGGVGELEAVVERIL